MDTIKYFCSKGREKTIEERLELEKLWEEQRRKHREASRREAELVKKYSGPVQKDFDGSWICLVCNTGRIKTRDAYWAGTVGEKPVSELYCAKCGTSWEVKNDILVSIEFGGELKKELLRIRYGEVR